MIFLKRKLKKCCRSIQTDGRTVIAGIIIVLFAGILVRLLSGSPIFMLRVCGLWGSIPKIWFFTAMWTMWYIVLGFCFGFILGTKNPGKGLCKYKGSFWFVIMMIFNIVWYPLFFKAGAIFLSLADILIIIFFCLLCAFEYFKIQKAVGCIMLLHLLWLLWCFILNVKALLSI